MNNYSSRDDIKEYYESIALSQSRLKTLLGHPKNFNNDDEKETELYYEEKEHFIVGSAVDCLLTEGDAVFNELYYVDDCDKPGEKVMAIVHEVYDTVLKSDTYNTEMDMTNPLLRDIILLAANNNAYYTTWGASTRVNKLIDTGNNYYKHLANADGKQILSTAQSELITKIKESLVTNKRTGKYFNLDEPDVDVLYQHPIYFRVNNIPCKALLDMIIVDNREKTITPIDIKTLGDYTLNFPRSVKKRRYDIQAAFYMDACRAKFPGYTILPFTFIVESTKDPGEPLVFECSSEVLDIGKWGRQKCRLEMRTLDSDEPVNVITSEIKGYMELLELYEWHKENGFNEQKVVSLSDEKLIFDWSGIIY